MAVKNSPLRNVRAKSQSRLFKRHKQMAQISQSNMQTTPPLLILRKDFYWLLIPVAMLRVKKKKISSNEDSKKTPISTRFVFRVLKQLHDTPVIKRWTEHPCIHVMRRRRRREVAMQRARGKLPCTRSCCLPGITEIALKALRTLNVRRAERLPRFTNSVTYL